MLTNVGEWHQTLQLREHVCSVNMLIPHQPLSVAENKVQHSPSPHWFLYCLEKEVIINAFQEPPGFLVPCCVVPPTDIGGVVDPHEDQNL